MSEETITSRAAAIATIPIAADAAPAGLGDTVRQALKRPLLACFLAELETAGYRLEVAGPWPVVMTLPGGPATALADLGLRREYWLRYCEVPDGLALEELAVPLNRIGVIWEGLFGTPPDDSARGALRRFFKHLPAHAVAYAAYAACWRKPDADHKRHARTYAYLLANIYPF